MKCPACSHENRDGAKFCNECAGPLKRVCASCGAELDPTAKFCDECAAPTGADAAQPKRPAEPAGARKVVTVVFSDLVGSTALHERMDAESARRLMERYYDALRGAVEEHGGTVVKLLGDGVMAAFGVPQVAEDDALRAVCAGVAMQDAFRLLVSEQAASLVEVGLRVAVNTGEVVVSGANDDVVGDPVNVAARLQQEARDGDVVIGEATQRLVSTLVTLAPLGSFALKGRAEAVKAYRVVSLERPAGASATPFVGREEELARITRVYDAAVATPAARLAVLLGSPGLGKSRLIDELARRQGETATVISAHCDATGGATFAPLARALRSAMHIDDGASVETLRAAVDADTPGSEPDRARIVDGITALLAGSPASPEETFFVVRRLFAALATERPVVLVIDDLQWAEPLLLDLVEHLIQWGSGVPLLVLVGARPELRDTRSSLATMGGLVADVITLSGLDAGAAMRLAASVIGATDLPAAVAAKVLATSEGNPLFVGELIRMLVQEGALERQGDRWTIGAGLAELEMPPTIHALLAARIERLRADERIVLERAAVVGRHFSRSAVAELLPRDVTDLDARLEALRRSELIERDTGWFLGEPVLRFHHVLIRDAAYRRVLKGTRAELHARFADWIEARVGESVEHDEILGWHLEQAHLYLGELGPVDAKGRLLGERAARHLAAAGRRALARDDLPLAASLLGRALARLDADNPSRADLALDWCEALLATGDVGPAARAIAELGRFIADSERLRAWHTCFAGQLTVFTEPQALHATTDAVAAAAETLTSLGDAAGEAKAHFVHAQALARLGKIGACEAALDRALAAARRAGDRRRANAVLAGAPLAALWGPSPVTRASGRCLDVVRVLRITQGAPAVEAVALSCQGVLEALRGRTDAARRMIASSRKMVEELGITHRLLEADVFAGQIDLLEGNASAAERSLRGAYEGLRDLGLGIDAAQAAALLARALLAQGRAAEAEALSHECEALAGDDLKAAIAWRGVRAEALARRGEHTLAVELAEAAVAIASATDALLDHADARLALAAALRAAGHGSEANAEERRATELWEAKGATLLAERARRGAVRVDAPTQAREGRVESTAPTQRRVRANDATAAATRVDAAFASRDRLAIEAVHAEAVTVVDHPTESAYGREGSVDSFARMFRMEDPRVRHDTVATLGESLGLFRFRASARGTGGGRFDVGEFDRENINVYEADEHARIRRVEVFANDRLDDAIAGLYERYAELFPDGVARTRAETTARAIATTMREKNGGAERWRTACASDAQAIDNRRLGTWNARGADAIVEQMGSLREVADGVDIRTLEILRLEPEALLLRRMHSGTERVGGGVYERPFLLLKAFGTDGRVARLEFFDDAAEAAALARFHELVGRSDAEPVRPVQRRIRPNAASAVLARIDAAFRARDLDAVDAALGDRLETVEHPSGATYGREGQLEASKRMLRLSDLDFRSDDLATLGDSLLLHRRHVAASGTSAGNFDVGAYEIEHVIVAWADAAGRIGRSEVFPSDHLADAIVRLYELRAEQLQEGSPRQRLVGISRSVAKFHHGLVDPQRLDSPFAVAVQMVDHRRVGLGTLEGADAVLTAVRAFLELVEDVAWRIDDVLALTEDASLFRSTNTGIDRAGGGSFERTILSIAVYDAEGRVERWETFEIDDEAAALARFDELAGSRDFELSAPQAATRFANAATRLNEGFVRTWAARDWDAFMALHAPTCELDDRRRLMRLEGTSSNFPTLQMLFEVPGGRWTITPLATRGERLALSRLLFEGQFVEGGGDLAIDYLCVDEVDAEGLSAVVVLFDLDELDAAYAELDARYDASEARVDERPSGWFGGFRRALADRNWQALAALCAPNIVAEDHRMVSWGTLRGPAAWAAAIEKMLELAPDTRLRVDHVRTSLDGLLYEGAWLGTRDGGEFEIPFVVVVAVDELGRQLHLDVYDTSHLGNARARFDVIGSSRTLQEQRFANASARASAVSFECYAARDWSGLERLLATGFRYFDRRRIAQLELDRDQYIAFQHELDDLRTPRYERELLATRGELLSLQRYQFEYAGGDVGESEVEFVTVIEADERGELVAFVRFDADDLDAAYAELNARFEALRERSSPDPLTEIAPSATTRAAIAKSNAADAAMLRWRALFEKAIADGGWDSLHRICAPGFVFEDRRRLALLAGGVELMVASARERVAIGASPHGQLVGTAGDRIAISRMLWTGGPAEGRFEIEYLTVSEVDEAGQLTAILLFDCDDAGIAQREAWTRWAAIDPVAAPWVELVTELADAWNAQDRSRVRAKLTDDVVVEDHRRTGLGRIEGVDAYLESIGVLWNLAPDQRIEFGWSWPALDRHGALVTLRREGTLADGGAFESDYLWLGLAKGGRLTRLELFEPEDLDAALARFEELREDPLRVLLNAATTRQMRVRDAMERADWDAVRALCSAGFVYEDRGKRSLVSGNVETWIASMEFMVAIPDYRNEYQRIATMGERISIVYEVWTGGSDTAPFEIEHFRVSEVAADGKYLATILFDPDDRAAAFSEAFERFLPGEAAAMSGRVGILAFRRAEATRDWGTLRETLTPDFVFHDHRTLGMGELDRDRWIASIRALVDMSPDMAVELTQVLAWNRHGLVTVTRVCGTVPDGGPFENVFIAVRQMAGNRTRRYEVFNLDDVDRALARFEELSTSSASDPLRIPPNAATRALQRNAKVVAARDWATLRGLVSEDFVFEDRGKRALVSGGVEAFVGGLTYFVSEVGAVGRQEILATAGERLSLTRMAWRGVRDAQFEVDRFIVNEVNDEGKICANILFDDDGRAAASDEMLQRYVRSDDVPAVALEIVRAWNDHDLERLRTLLPDDYYFHDRRRTGVGRLDGADAYLASLVALFELSRDVRIETLYNAARAEHGAVNVTRWVGTNVEGGEFEAVYVFLGLQHGDRIIGSELFEIEDLDAALARFEELSTSSAGEPLRIPPNAATRTRDRWAEAAWARDWAAVRALVSDDFVFDDRSKRSLVQGDVETWIAQMQFTISLTGIRSDFELIATQGERIALDHLVLSGGDGEKMFEMEGLRLYEVDTDGRLRTLMLFDPDDRAAAFLEALKRFATGEAATTGAEAVMLAGYQLCSAHVRRHWGALRETLAPDFVYHDHRALGVLGVLDGDQWVASIGALADISSDSALEMRRLLAWNRHGVVALYRTVGTVPGGGPFESVFLGVVHGVGGCVQRFEAFDLDDTERALARFEELCTAQGERAA